MSAKIEPGSPVILKHVGSGVFGIKERKGYLHSIETTRDQAGTSTVLNVFVSPFLYGGGEASVPVMMRFDTSNRQLAPVSEWRLHPDTEAQP